MNQKKRKKSIKEANERHRRWSWKIYGVEAKLSGAIKTFYEDGTTKV